MHPIIKEYIETDKKITKILNEFASKDQPVELAFQIILKKINNAETISSDENKQIDEALQRGHPDEEVYLFFLSYLMLFYSIKSMYIKCDSLYRIASGISISKYQPIIQAYYHHACSFYFYEINNITKYNEMRFASFSIMPKDCPRYQIFLPVMGQMMGILGRLQDLPKEDLKIIEKLADTSYSALAAVTDNALYIGDITLYNKYNAEISRNHPGRAFLGDDISKSIIEVFQGNFEEKKNVPTSFNFCLAYYKSLKDREIETAKLIYSKIDHENICSIFMFIKYHHSFITGRYEIFEKIIKNGANQSDHYLEDFFLARYFLVKDRKDLARFHYAQLLKNCEKFYAINRLKFEMQFAIEMTPNSSFELTQPLQIVISDENSKSLAAELITPESVSLGINRLVGSSNVISDIKKKVKSFANIKRPLLVIGETGAGKEVVARAIHEESTIKNEPFLPINCGALTDTLLQSGLFGYEVGAFTGATKAQKGVFESAGNGIVFLDEFGEMSPKLQVSLLRVLENNEIRRIGGTKVITIKCQIIAATNANIEELISKKLFREDLYHRLKQFTIFMPPLRDRPEDITELVNYFFAQQNAEHKQVLSDELMLRFQEYHWPGNIRELKNEIDRIKILCGYKPIIEIKDIEIEWIKNNNKALLPSMSENKGSNNLDEQIKQRRLNKKLTYADRRSQQITELFRQHKRITRGQIAEILQVSLVTVSNDLQRLCDEGVIIKREPTLSPRSFYYEMISS